MLTAESLIICVDILLALAHFPADVDTIVIAEDGTMRPQVKTQVGVNAEPHALASEVYSTDAAIVLSDSEEAPRGALGAPICID